MKKNAEYTVNGMESSFLDGGVLLEISYLGVKIAKIHKLKRMN